MMSAEEIERKFGISAKEAEELAAPWERGEVAGEPVGEVIVGRPLKFGQLLKLVGFPRHARRGGGHGPTRRQPGG